jgi:hypothetical protein
MKVERKRPNSFVALAIPGHPMRVGPIRVGSIRHDGRFDRAIRLAMRFRFDKAPHDAQARAGAHAGSARRGPGCAPLEATP